ncbi:MAG: hypothetical protein LC797_15455 [Chloroflexi bacterium]|nr:hypothetical protein [Chloroflexota bacterium]
MIIRRFAKCLVPGLVLSLVVLVGSASPAPVVQAAGPSALAGTPGPGAPGTRIDPRQVSAPVGDTPEQLPRRYPVDEATLGRLKAQANAAAAARDAGGGVGLSVAPTPKFPGLSMGDAGGWNPPDAGLAVGLSAVLVAVNEGFAIYDRQGTKKLPASAASIGFQGFFGTAGSTYDPRALYDAGQAHFVLLATTGGLYALATSQTADPTGAWCTYRLSSDPTGATWADYPGLGMDGDNLYITSNQFSSSSNSFQDAQLLVIPKTSVYAGAGACPQATSTLFANLQNPDGGNSFTVQPANQPDAVAGQGGPMHLVNAIWSSGSNLVVRSVTSTPAGPTLNPPAWVSAGAGANGFIGKYDLPADTPQPKGQAVDTGDTRLLGAAQRYGQIYTANTTMYVNSQLSASPNPYANAQWYVLTPAPTPAWPSATTGQSFAVTNRSVAYFFPGVLPGCAGQQVNGTCATTPFVALQVSGAGRSQAASAFTVIGGQQPAVYQPGVAGFTKSSRWGDYPAIASDPSVPAQVWVLGEYARTTSNWGTAVGIVKPQ